MAKKESSLLQLILSLTLISIVAGVALAVVYSVTKTPIAMVQEQKKANAIQQVLPGFDGEIKEMKIMPENGKDSLIIYMAYTDNQWFGAAIETYTDIAFSGSFSIMVGFDVSGNITGTEVLQMNETPGLGDKIDKSKDKFPLQFNGKNPGTTKMKVTKDGGDIDAITAATISSRAFCDAVERAYQAFLKIKEVHHE